MDSNLVNQILYRSLQPDFYTCLSITIFKGFENLVLIFELLKAITSHTIILEAVSITVDWSIYSIAPFYMHRIMFRQQEWQVCVNLVVNYLEPFIIVSSLEFANFWDLLWALRKIVLTWPFALCYKNTAPMFMYWFCFYYPGH